MFRWINHALNINKTKFQDAYQIKHLILILDHLMNLMYGLVRNTGKNLQKQQKVRPYCTAFSSTSVTTPMLLVVILLGFVSNLNLHSKGRCYEQLSKHWDNQMIKDIYLLTSKQSTCAAWFLFRDEGMITASFMRFY